MIIEPASRYARTNIISVDPGDTVQDLLGIMARERVRHVMVRGSGEFITVDNIFSLIYRMLSVARDPRHLETMKIGFLKTLRPPRVSGYISIAEAARVMASTRLDFTLVDTEKGTGILTVRDIIRAVEPSEARDPAIRYSTPRYPSVGPSSKVVDVVKTMGMHGVRSVLVLEGRSAVGVIPSLSVIGALSHLGFHGLWDEALNVAHPVEAVAPATASIGDTAHKMREYDTEAVVLEVEGHVVGVVDEWGVIRALAGHGDRLVLGS